MKNTKDTRKKALVLFNFAGLEPQKFNYIRVLMSNRYPQHEVFTDAKYFKKHKYDYNWFACTVEPVIDGISVLHRMSTGIRLVLSVSTSELGL